MNDWEECKALAVYELVGFNIVLETPQNMVSSFGIVLPYKKLWNHFLPYSNSIKIEEATYIYCQGNWVDFHSQQCLFLAVVVIEEKLQIDRVNLLVGSPRILVTFLGLQVSVVIDRNWGFWVQDAPWPQCRWTYLNWLSHKRYLIYGKVLMVLSYVGCIINVGFSFLEI